MTESNQIANLAFRCPRCGALIADDVESCWLCGLEFGGGAETGLTLVGAAPRYAASREPTGGFSLASLMMFVTLVCVVLGLATIAPGIGIPLGFLLLIPWLRTAAVAKVRRTYGKSTSRGEKLVLFVESFSVSVVATVAMLAIVAIAGFSALVVALGEACGNIGMTRQTGSSNSVPVFIAVAIPLTIGLVIGLALLVRKRWRRDIGEPD